VRLKEAEGKRSKDERFRRKRSEDKIYIRKTRLAERSKVKRSNDYRFRRKKK
jgi:hypothetical protein